MSSQLTWYLALDYFNNNISLLYSLYSCKIRSWSLCFRQFGVCRVNTAQGSTLLHSCLPNKWAKFSTINVRAFRRCGDFRVAVCFWLTLCVMSCLNDVDPVTKINKFEWPRRNGSRPGVVQPGDTFNCSANGRPQPSYTWQVVLCQNLHYRRQIC